MTLAWGLFAMSKIALVAPGDLPGSEWPLPLPANADAVPRGLGLPAIAAGAQIATLKGFVSVEALSPGDKVITRDRGAQPLAGIRRIDPRAPLAPGTGPETPVVIRAGALGEMQPVRDLLVSAHQRVYLRMHRNGARTSDPIFDLVPASYLCNDASIHRSTRPVSGAFFALGFAHREIIQVENIQLECLELGHLDKAITHNTRALADASNIS